MDEVIKEYPNGVYEARVLIPNPKAQTDPTAPKFLEKRGENQDSTSMLFPKTWTEDRLKVELEHAFKMVYTIKGKYGLGSLNQVLKYNGIEVKKVR
ncbi:EndoU domain-containing protein [Pasteurella multocida]|uniref:EndoU domain-containing protein n=1 Tax=Pasteurella multocida TaxID=747 RepID=UPI002157EC07|nr:EndoU domain-containing protein [Pasteurella multocida]